MSYEERRVSAAKPHSINLDERKNLSINGVERVDSFDEHEIIMLTSGGNLIIRGDELHMGRLDLAAGEATVTGVVSELCYEEVANSRSLWARLFH
ncbi:MAG: sporulation protein YabP [Ruminococcaceae bacterium]|nr:sporulation protein YabP [Oscillospiraceae bacterium]